MRKSIYTEKLLVKTNKDLFIQYLNVKEKFGKGGFYQYGEFIKDADSNKPSLVGWVCVGHRKQTHKMKMVSKNFFVNLLNN